MRSQSVVFSAISALALAAALPMIGSPAFAQQGGAAKQSADAAKEEITVVGPRIMRTKVRGTAETGYGVGYYDLLTLTHQVGYEDLNLNQPNDVKVLENRIEQAADQVCEQLAATPPAEPKSLECVRRAVESAREQVQIAEAVAAAKR